MATIGMMTIERATQNLGELLVKHMADIDRANNKLDNDLTVSLKVKFSPHRTGATSLSTDITFVESKISDGKKDLVDELQRELFPEDD